MLSKRASNHLTVCYLVGKRHEIDKTNTNLERRIKKNIFFIIQCVKARVIPCPHQPPTRVDDTVSVSQGGISTPGATKRLLPPDKVFKRIIYIYIYIYS